VITELKRVLEIRVPSVSLKYLTWADIRDRYNTLNSSSDARLLTSQESIRLETDKEVVRKFIFDWSQPGAFGNPHFKEAHYEGEKRQVCFTLDRIELLLSGVK